MKFLEHYIDDKNFLRYVARFLKAGIMEDVMIYESDKGAPQGGLISLVLSNVYLHYVLELWVERVAKQHCDGNAHYVRYADDFLVLFKYRTDAVKFQHWLKARLTKYGVYRVGVKSSTKNLCAKRKALKAWLWTRD